MGTLIGDRGHFRGKRLTISFDFSHNLRILGLLESDAGMFQCIGSNPAGSVQAAARLQIGEPSKCSGFIFRSIFQR